MPAPPIMFDLICHACGYNLRTLDQKGHCPECGNSVAETLRLHQTSDPTLSDCDPAQVLRWMEGLGCVLASAGIGAAVSCWLLLQSFSSSRSERVIMLSGVCTAWVLNGCGVLKVTELDAQADRRMRFKKVFQTIPLSAGCFFALPAIMFCRDWVDIPYSFRDWLMLGSVLIGLLVCVVFYLRLIRFARLLKLPSLRNLLIVLACASAPAMLGFASISAFNELNQSLESMLLIPTPTFITSTALAFPVFFFQQLGNGFGGVLVFLISLLLFLLAAVQTVAIAWLLRRMWQQRIAPTE